MYDAIYSAVKDFQLARSGQKAALKASRPGRPLDVMFIEPHARGEKRKSFYTMCKKELFPAIDATLVAQMGELSEAQVAQARLLAAITYLAPLTITEEAGERVYHSRRLAGDEIAVVLGMAERVGDLADHPAQFALAFALGWFPRGWEGETPWTGRPFAAAMLEMQEAAKPAAIRFIASHFAPLTWPRLDLEKLSEFIMVAIAHFVDLKEPRTEQEKLQVLSMWRKSEPKKQCRSKRNSKARATSDEEPLQLSLMGWWTQALLGHYQRKGVLEAGKFAKSLLGAEMLAEGWVSKLPVAYVELDGEMVEYFSSMGEDMVVYAQERIVIGQSLARYFSTGRFGAFTMPGLFPDHLPGPQGEKLYFVLPSDHSKRLCPFPCEWESAETTRLLVRREQTLDALSPDTGDLDSSASLCSVGVSAGPLDSVCERDTKVQVEHLRKKGLSRNEIAAVMLGQMRHSNARIAQTLGVSESKLASIVEKAQRKLKKAGAMACVS